MGYRSQVVLAVNKEIGPHFTAFLAQNPASHRLCAEADEFKSGYEEDGDWLVFWDSIKWYKGYEDVDPIINFIQSLEDEHPDYDDIYDLQDKWKFIAIGEDYDDIKEMGSGFWDISLERKITF